MRNPKNKGFTLSEVLITLVIIGVISAITIPSLMHNTNATEYRTALKKAISGVNQALALHYSLDHHTAQDYSSADELVDDVFTQRMNIIDTPDEFTSQVCDGSVFTTSDGMIFCVDNFYSEHSDSYGAACDFFNTEPCTEIDETNLWIDVNGEKKPNLPTTSSDNPKDIYQAQIYSQRVIAYGAPTQEVLYDKEIQIADNSSDDGIMPMSDDEDLYPPAEDTPPVEEDDPFNLWDPETWPDFNDFLDWIRDILGYIFS